MYKEIKNLVEGGISNSILRIEDNSFIPPNPANTDYQEYLKWLEEGNTPEAAE
jgi:hypothetical protein